MKIITSHTRKGNIDYKIYENVDEFKKCKKKLATFDDCDTGDYLKTDNGFYMPLISKKRYNRTLTVEFWVFIFPRFQMNMIKYNNTQRWKRKQFLYQHEAYKNIKITQTIRVEDLLFAELIKADIGVREAYNKAYGKTYDIQAMSKKLWHLFENIKFISILSEGTMKLKDSFEEAGVTQKWLGEQLKKMLENDKTSDKMKEKVIDLSLKILDDDSILNIEGKENIKFTDKVSQEQINSAMNVN